MLELNSIMERVNQEELKKSDVAVKLTDTIPLVSEDGIKLSMGGRRTYGMTNNGLSSLLNKVNVPTAFFKRSSALLQRQILDEHFYEQAKGQNVVLRTKKSDHSEFIRYVASNMYSKFDDVHVIESLTKVNDIENFKVREFHQTDEFLVMRLTTPEALEIKGRPFYPGVQVINSEIGKSSVHIAFLLWEEVCTNGMTVVRDEYASFRQKHLGKRGANMDLLAEKASKFLSSMDTFKDDMYQKLSRLSDLSYEEVMSRIERDKRIPKKIKEIIPSEYLQNYAPSQEEASGLDVMSAFTEAIQRYSWDGRLQYEDMAGNLMLELQ